MDRPRITEEQFLAVQRSNGQPVYLVDAAGNEASLAIVRVELVHLFTGDDTSIRETYPAQEVALAPLWDDPQLDEYTAEDGSPID